MNREPAINDTCYVKIVRVQSLQYICGYIGSHEDLAEINKKLHQVDQAARKLVAIDFFEDQKKPHVFALYKGNFYRGTIVEKFEPSFFNVKLPDLGLFVRLHSSHMVNDPDPLSVKDFYPICYFTQSCYWKSIGSSPAKQSQFKDMLNYLVSEGLPPVPCLVESKSKDIFSLRMCVYEKSDSNYTPRHRFFDVLNTIPKDESISRHLNDGFLFVHPRIKSKMEPSNAFSHYTKSVASAIVQNHPQLQPRAKNINNYPSIDSRQLHDVNNNVNEIKDDNFTFSVGKNLQIEVKNNHYYSYRTVKDTPRDSQNDVPCSSKSNKKLPPDQQEANHCTAVAEKDYKADSTGR